MENEEVKNTKNTEEVKQEKKRLFDNNVAIIVLVIGFMLMAGAAGYLLQKNYKQTEQINNITNITCTQNCTLLEQKAFMMGAEYGTNYSIQSLLYYSQNCSVVMVNYTNNIYSFIDTHCINASMILKK